MTNNFALLNMLQVCDSLFPIGAFTLSNGMETYVQKGKLKTATDLQNYVNSYMQTLAYNELGLMVLAHNASTKELLEIDNLWAALRSAMEVRKGSERLASRFIKLFDKIELTPSLKIYKDLISNKNAYGHHPIAVGLFVKDKQIDLKQATQIYAYSLVSAIVTNAVKTVPLSQIDGQRILYNSFSLIEKSVEVAMTITTRQLGISGTEMEIYAMNHETLYSRIYMS